MSALSQVVDSHLLVVSSKDGDQREEAESLVILIRVLIPS